MSDIILSKVKKLLALGNSPNEAEAQSAIEKAHQLLKDYNLSISDIEQDSKYGIIEKVISESKNDIQWKKFIMIGVAKANYCIYLATKSHIGIVNQYIGKEHNVVVAKEMTTYLFNTVERLSKQHSGSIRGDYKKGLAYTLCDRLMEINNAEKTECTALILQEEVMNNQYLKEKHSGTKEVSTKVRAKNYSAFDQGRIDGNSISLNGQVGGQRSTLSIG
ncbi:MAG: DUF2786 domain-containing protein [Vulcanibacillus sp.]